jgi:hypothetical protein
MCWNLGGRIVLRQPFYLYALEKSPSYAETPTGTRLAEPDLRIFLDERDGTWPTVK